MFPSPKNNDSPFFMETHEMKTPKSVKDKVCRSQCVAYVYNSNKLPSALSGALTLRTSVTFMRFIPYTFIPVTVLNTLPTQDEDR